MTENNLFCYSEKYNDSNSFQQQRYRVFNKGVGEERYSKILSIMKKILGDNTKLLLADFWKEVTFKQWNNLLAIPEANDFKEGFEYISGIKLPILTETSLSGKTVKIILDGKEWEAVIK